MTGYLIPAVCMMMLAESSWLEMPLRSRKQKDGQDAPKVAIGQARIRASRTAVIVCDMWDQHWCSGATRRVGKLAERMNPFLSVARSAGVLIVYAPSETMDFYKDSPQRSAIRKAPPVDPPPPVPIDEAPLPIDDKKGGCDTGDEFRRAWTRQTPALTIAPEDLISDDGREIYSYLRMRGIDTVLIMGVHTNMCILNRSFAIKQMTKWGMRCILVRDLTDSMYNPADYPYVSHDRGTELVIEHIEKHWAPSVESGEIRFVRAPAEE